MGVDPHLVRAPLPCARLGPPTAPLCRMRQSGVSQARARGEAGEGGGGKRVQGFSRAGMDRAAPLFSPRLASCDAGWGRGGLCMI